MYPEKTKPDKGQQKIVQGSSLAVMPHPQLMDTATLNKITPCRLQHIYSKYWIKHASGGHSPCLTRITNSQSEQANSVASITGNV